MIAFSSPPCEPGGKVDVVNTDSDSPPSAAIQQGEQDRGQQRQTDHGGHDAQHLDDDVGHVSAAAQRARNRQVRGPAREAVGRAHAFNRGREQQSRDRQHDERDDEQNEAERQQRG